MDSKPPGKPPPEAPATKLKPKRKRRSPVVPWKKPKDMPKRPLSAYNIFFRHEREKIMKGDESMDQKPAATGRKEKPGIGFANLARTVAAKWKTLPPEEKAPFEMEASRERARYDSQMLGWRAEQEQKKARKAGSSQQMIEELTSGPALQAYAARLSAEQQNYPETWFQATEQPSQGNFDAASHLLGMREQQQRALLAQQLQQQQAMQMPPPSANRFFTMAGNYPARDVYYMDDTRRQLAQQQTEVTRVQFAQQQAQAEAALLGTTSNTVEQKESEKMPSRKASLPYHPGQPGGHIPRGPGTSFELRTEEYGPTNRPSILEQRSLMERASLGYPPPQRQFGEESSFTAGLIQQSFWSGPVGRETNQQQASEGELPRVARIEHRSSIGTPQHQFPHRPLGKVRSQSFPSTFAKAPSPEEESPGKMSHKLLPSPDESSGKQSLDSRGGGLDTPYSPWLQSPFLQQSPHVDSQSILMSPNMVPTPPQQNDAFMNLMGDGNEVSRPLHGPPPNFPGEEEFQSIEARYYHQHQGQEQANPPEQGPGGNETGGIRSREGMVADPNETSTTRQRNQNDPSMSWNDNGLDFLSNLKFEED